MTVVKDDAVTREHIDKAGDALIEVIKLLKPFSIRARKRIIAFVIDKLAKDDEEEDKP